MAFCGVCGEKAGIGKTVCNSCQQQLAAEREVELANRRAEEREAFEAHVTEALQAWASSASTLIGAGSAPTVYKSVYVTIDSVVTGSPVADFDMSLVQAAGLQGWKVEGIIPRTEGIGLTNVSYGSSSGETWGAGIGGNVVRAYVIMSRKMTGTGDESDEIAFDLARELLEAGYDI